MRPYGARTLRSHGRAILNDMTLRRIAWILLLCVLMFSLFQSALWFSTASAETDPAADLIERGAYKRARAVLAPRLAAHPDDAVALGLMSQVQMAFGDPKASLASAEKAVQLDPKSGTHHLQLAEVYGQMAQKAGPLKALGLAKKFRKEAEATIALDPRQIDARIDLMEFYIEAPGIAGGDKKKAKAMADEILGLDAVRGNIAHARLALSRKDSSGAEAFYRKATEADPINYRGQLAAANWYAGSSRTNMDLAEKHARAAREIDPRRTAPYVLLALIYAHLSRWTDLDAVLAAAEQSVPDNLAQYYQAARTLITDHREPARAERYLRRYLSGEPEAYNPTLAHAHWRLAGALDQQGRKAEAVAELETALKMKPDLDEAKKDLKRLKRS